jgi:hypothetical protein
MAEEIPSWLISYDISEIARKLKELKDLKEAYERAETYCDKVCKKWYLNPMISCAYTCEIWKLKNKILAKRKI